MKGVGLPVPESVTYFTCFEGSRNKLEKCGETFEKREQRNAGSRQVIVELQEKLKDLGQVMLAPVARLSELELIRDRGHRDLAKSSLGSPHRLEDSGPGIL